ncbi:MAG: WYL domain-containing protein [Planctomycetes bacterium]|nr:WYL domain-containing protein [Planctomycetota bacterium]MBL7043219.1 WYL domain-containing protein [Pirellulaceae bacterium]
MAESEDHRGLPDARLAMAVFRRTVGRSKRLKTADDLFRVSSPMTFADAGTSTLVPPAGFEDLSVAIAEQLTVVLMYEGGTTGLVERRITPRGLLQSRGRSYLTALCHYSDTEKTYRLDRIQEFWIEE